MLPTLKPGQDVLVLCWVYLWSQPKVGDIVAIKVNGKEMIKRIQKTDDSPGEASAKRGRRIFVIGENKNMSTDSRKFGWVDKKDITGKVIWSR